MMLYLGSIGMGAVWGWLLGWRTVRAGSFIKQILPLAGGTLAFIAQIWLMTGPGPALAFLASVFTALTVHLIWRRDLQQRFKS